MGHRPHKMDRRASLAMTNICHCERSEAVQVSPANGAWIATLRSR